MADGSDDLITINEMIEKFNQGDDIVCGSRYMLGGSQKGGFFLKSFLSKAAGISLIERLKREGKNSLADLILLVDAARITNAEKADLLQKIESDSLEKDVPFGLKDINKKWYALTRRVRVIVANPKVVDINLSLIHI